jgi:predicted PhzF superfamily epimerase YddE/YHI9
MRYNLSVTGSAYTQLAPYWASKIGSKRFSVKQVSSRGGELTCEIIDDRVLISGKAIKYLEGKINIEAQHLYGLRMSRENDSTFI